MSTTFWTVLVHRCARLVAAHTSAAFNGSVQHTLTGFANSGLSIEASFTPDSKFVVGGARRAPLSPDVSSLYTGSEDGNVCVWEVESGARIASFVAHKEACTALRFNPRFSVFASVANELVRPRAA